MAAPGRDGTNGNGPGTGGGVGIGNRHGRGSGIGPGTGGGTSGELSADADRAVHSAASDSGQGCTGFHLVAEFDVDETGKVVDFDFTDTARRRLQPAPREVLKSFKFRPGTTPDGKPIRMKAQIVYDF